MAELNIIIVAKTPAFDFERAMSTQVAIALTTCSDAQTADRIATTLVSEKLAACVNQIPGIQSTYVWNGQLQREREILLLIKTTQEHLATVAARVKALHPYDLPELIAVPVCAGSQTYLDWVRQNVGLQD